MKNKLEKTKVEIAPPSEADLARQHAYVETLSKYKGFPPLVAAETFVQSMRDSGYKSTATALLDLTDNGFEASARRVDVIYTETKASGKGNKPKVAGIAVIDDGHGMEPEMIRAAVVWGGTHRSDQRSSFGRYGFGLPSASVSITERYTVYSKVKDGQWHSVSIDIRAVAEGKLTDDRGVVVAPKAQPAELPDFVRNYLGEREFMSGTVVVLHEPDRLTSGFVTAGSFKAKMLETLGLVYRGLLRNHDIYVQGTMVDMIDPLFLDPSGRFHDVGNDQVAEARPPLTFQAKSADGSKIGTVHVRYSFMGPDFIQDDKSKGGKHAGRNAIRSQHRGFFIVTRAGRQIDVVSRLNFPRAATGNVLMNNDSSWAVEIDFDPVLDELFGVTVNKQQIAIKEPMWAILQDQGVGEAIAAMRAEDKKLRQDKKAKGDNKEDSHKVSEEVMEKTQETARRVVNISEETQQEAVEKVERDAKQIAEKTGADVVEITKNIIEKTQEKPYKIVIDGDVEGPFFRVEKYGSQTRLHINPQHRFYSDVYAAPDSTPRVKAALELLMFVLGEAELGSSQERQLFYKGERKEWSDRLDTALTYLDKFRPVASMETDDDERTA